MITLTNNALTEVKRLLAKESDTTLAFRVAVKNGGCSGMFYNLGFTKELDTDNVETQEGLKIIVDPVSAGYLDGTTIDFVDGLNERGFKFNNPNAKGCCGCGESFCPKE